MSEVKYKRVLLKLSGEALAGDKKTGVNPEVIGKMCDKIKEVVEMGVQVAIVVGGGNFWRGRQGMEMERTTADYMGMLATAMNGLALQDALETRGIHSRVQTAIEMREIAEPFIQRKAEKHLNRGRVVIIACGTGHPYFTTDTAAVLRAAEIGAEVILVGKTISEALNTDLVCDAINTAMRELFLQIVYGRTQTAFSEGGLPVGAGLEDLGKGHTSQVGTIYSSSLKGPRYLQLTEGNIVELGLDKDDQIIGYKYVHMGKMMDNIKKGIDPMEAIEKASGTYGRFDEAVKKIDPREE